MSLAHFFFFFFFYFFFFFFFFFSLGGGGGGGGGARLVLVSSQSPHDPPAPSSWPPRNQPSLRTFRPSNTLTHERVWTEGMGWIHSPRRNSRVPKRARSSKAPGARLHRAGRNPSAPDWLNLNKDIVAAHRLHHARARDRPPADEEVEAPAAPVQARTGDSLQLFSPTSAATSCFAPSEEVTLAKAIQKGDLLAKRRMIELDPWPGHFNAKGYRAGHYASST